MGSTFSKVGDFVTGSGDQVAGTGSTVGELKNIGYSPAEIAQMGGGQMTTGQKVAKGFAGIASPVMQSMGQQSQQPRGGYSPQIQVTPTPDVSGYYPVRPLTPGTPPNAMPYNYGDAFYGR